MPKEDEKKEEQETEKLKKGGLLTKDINYAKQEFSQMADEKLEKVETMTNDLYDKFSSLVVAMTFFVVVTGSALVVYIKKKRKK